MEAIVYLGFCWLVLWDSLWVKARAPNTKSGLGDEVVQGTPKSQMPTDLPKVVADRCRGYYDVMGQWDPPFNCNASSYLYCCGTCGYRFCCQFKHGRLDQSTCSNYDTPNWANTGKPPAKGEESSDDPSKDKTNMIVYIICGVAALLVLVGIFTKLAVEKSHTPQTDMGVSRTLTELLKQPANVDLLSDGRRGSIQVQITEVIPRVSPRNSIESTTEDFFKRFPLDITSSSPCYKPAVMHVQDSSPLPDTSALNPIKPNHKVKVSKTNTHPLTADGFQGWDSSHHDIRRHVYANKKQYSIEKLPEIFSQQGHYTSTPQRHFSSNSKTEVTV
ncbi:hypothetical protein GDO86_007490 [Hymenochirus boettgeri]|uniref:Shisa N-terminal domain-containing protein n=1 Tax=Hymenochirus boettgeri TaxID=247094 RepID=A0A8T2IZB7_9PIPI|nr:hypothetical protein GDO86_007490 [Hymenochirus boettgeri]